ncbi:DUF2087 domain-containing protein [Arthrobacter sp. zg-Y1143]|uniref:DUF2087 domain-containing protein n=1 Tax=Arthrobacter sp. zg-Y1143 TaxID=3049065 RepID=UPI0024C2DF3C|nr:DUF2087 domain-containing protein [Arthrobacter sp. zg-Y1143]MDK1327942.1 DUF2087 domain-containing protein [Arthrobacter sp. zg-Y1143]
MSRPTPAPGDNRWRPVAAALADPRRLRLYARAVLAADDGAPLDPADLAADEAKSLAVLQQAGLLQVDGNRTKPAPSVFRDLLAAGVRPPESSARRFLVRGRIEAFPRKRADRLELLQLIAGEVFEHAVPPEPGLQPVLTEKDLTQRLAAYTSDPAAIRRYLIDEGIVARDPAGTQYWLTRPRPAEGMEFA